VGEDDNGVYVVVFKKAQKNGNLTEEDLTINLRNLKSDLESLSIPQVKLVLELIDHMKQVNEEDTE
jgi:hypothetical protein